MSPCALSVHRSLYSLNPPVFTHSWGAAQRNGVLNKVWGIQSMSGGASGSILTVREEF